MSLDLDKSSWTRVRFGDLVANINDYFSAARDGVLPYVAGPHIIAGQPTVASYGSTDDDDFPPTFKRKFRDQDVLVHSRGIEKIAAVDRTGVTGEKLFVLRSRDGSRLFQGFLPWLLMSPAAQLYMTHNFTGSVNKFLNWRPLASFRFNLPPVDDQRRIADLFWALERERLAVIGTRNAGDEARSAVRDELFAALSAPAHTFESICSIPSQNGVTLKKSERAGSVPMVNMGEMFKGEIIAKDSAYERVVDPQSRFHLAAGDLLFARRSIVFEGAGTCCIVPRLDEPFTFESSVIRSRIRHDIDPRFVLHFFRSERGRRAMAQIVRRGPVSGVSSSDLRKLRVPAPGLDEQLQTVRQIEEIEGMAPEMERRRATAGLLSKSMLAAVLGGI